MYDFTSLHTPSPPLLSPPRPPSGTRLISPPPNPPPPQGKGLTGVRGLLVYAPDCNPGRGEGSTLAGGGVTGGCFLCPVLPSQHLSRLASARLSLRVHTTCARVLAHVKDPVVHVRDRWSTETGTGPACTLLK